jgi:acyl carrier protein
MNETEIQKKLRTYICEEIIRNAAYPLANDEPLITGGLIDSYSLVHIGVFVETEFNVYIPDIDLTVKNMDTIDAMTNRILKEMAR